MRYSLSVFVAALLALTSCKKKSEDAPAPDYSPLTAGSTWTYQTNGGQSYTLTATNRDTTAMGRSYRVLSNSAGPNNYRAKSGNDYYRFGVVQGLGANGFEELYLKDGQALNATWQATQMINVPNIPVPVAATLTYTLKEKDITRTVGGKVYNKVQHVRLDVSVALFGSVGGGDFYYAEGIGLIESSLLLTAQGQQIANVSETLVSYSIK